MLRYTRRHATVAAARPAPARRGAAPVSIGARALVALAICLTLVPLAITLVPRTLTARATAVVPPLPVAVAARSADPRPEYPRPDFQRDHWLSLNGVWRFALDPQGMGEARRWYLAGQPGGPRAFAGRIIVPFPWQSLDAFGQGAQASPSTVSGPLASYAGTVWYARGFHVPASFPSGDRVVLNFGAAEQTARVWVNGHLAGTHDGGYLPFSFDVTSLLVAGGDNALAVEVTQPRNLTGEPHGKQGGSWYTASGGLWQSVWLEATGPAVIGAIHVTPDVPRGAATVAIACTGAAFHAARLRLTLSDPHGRPVLSRQITLAAGARSVTATLPIAHALLWDTDHPWLYHLTATLTAVDGAGRTLPPDSVHTYFGMRTVSVGQITARTANGAPHHYPYIYLNGRPIYIMGALDQDFNPWGVYTAPSDAFLREEILRARSLGLNLLRIHIKVPDPRLLYWADRLGMLIWEEPPDFAEDGTHFTSGTLTRWLTTLHGMLDRDYNHPATIIWGLFNEEWGLGDLRQAPDRARWLAGIYADVKRRDPTRLVVDQSGWSHTRTDVFDVHQYVADFATWRSFLDTFNLNLYRGSSASCGCISGSHDGFVSPYTYSDQPMLMSEYAAGPWTGDWPNKDDARPDGFRDNSAPFRWLTNDLRLHPYVAGYIYTQFSDVEWEHNGLMRYDRVPRQFGYAPPGLFPDFADTTTPRMVNAADFLAVDKAPIYTAQPGAPVSVGVWLSHFSSVALPAQATLRWRVAGYGGDGAWHAGLVSSHVVSLAAGQIIPLSRLTAMAPSGAFAGDLAIWLTIARGSHAVVLARTSFALVVPAQPTPGVSVHAARGATTVTWTVEPGAYASGRFTRAGPVRAEGDQVAWGSGSGALSYRLTVPSAARALLRSGRLIGASFLAEAGAELRARAGDQSAPQTDATPRPSAVRVTLGGAPLIEAALPGDPSDARGILSLQNGYEWGEYGYPLMANLRAGDARLRALQVALRRQSAAPLALRLAVPAGGRAGGLALYGERAGRVPAPLTMRLTFSTT